MVIRFEITIFGFNVKVYKIIYEEDDEYRQIDIEDTRELIKEYYNVDTIWVGNGEYSNVHKEDFLGNTILFVKKNECISIASEINSFILRKGEKVINYVSTVGNSGVPYGYIRLI